METVKDFIVGSIPIHRKDSFFDLHAIERDGVQFYAKRTVAISVAKRVAS
jgi:hypothetical protein